MSTTNTYATLADYKAHVTAPAQTISTDSADDAVIERLLEAASRYIDETTGRHFYPVIETRNFSIPLSRLLMLDEDLLEMTTFSNGDGTTIASTEYHLLPKNISPKYAAILTDVTSVTWECDTNNSDEYVLDVFGWWGYHGDYTRRGWKSGGTLGAAISDTTTLAFTMTAGHSIAAGQILKIDSEILIVNTVATNTVTPLVRGDNGSTAATHSNGATVYIWQVPQDIKQTCLEIAGNAYHRRFGQNLSGQAVVTPAGAVIGPQDITMTARQTIERYKRVI